MPEPAIKEIPVQQGLPDLPVLLALRVRQVRQGQVVLLVQTGLTVQMVLQDPPALLVQQDQPVLPVLRARRLDSALLLQAPDLSVLLHPAPIPLKYSRLVFRRVRQDPQVLQDPQDPQVQPALLVVTVLTVQPDLPVLRVQPVLLDQPDLPVLQGRKA
mgnify:CR=1 FL=1